MYEKSKINITLNSEKLLWRVFFYDQERDKEAYCHFYSTSMEVRPRQWKSDPEWLVKKVSKTQSW